MSARSERAALERARVEEGLRILLRRELRHTHQRLLSALIGISRSSLRKFVAGSRPEKTTLKRLREWAEDRQDLETPLGAIGLALLASEFPSPHRLRARQALASHLVQIYGEADHQPPAWLVEETTGRTPTD